MDIRTLNTDRKHENNNHIIIGITKRKQMYMNYKLIICYPTATKKVTIMNRIIKKNNISGERKAKRLIEVF